MGFSAVAAATVASAGIGAMASKSAASKQAQGAERAGEAQLAATQLSIEEQRRQFDLSRQDLLDEQAFTKPYRQDALNYGATQTSLGRNALAVLADIQGLSRAGGGSDGTPAGVRRAQSNILENVFMTSPGYQFRLNEGTKAVENSASARGLLHSGGTMKGIQRYGEGLASNEFDTYVNRLLSSAGMGTAGAGTGSGQGAGIPGQLASGAMAAGQGISNSLLAGGNARASSYLAQGNAQAQGIAGMASAANSGVQNGLLLHYLNRMPPMQVPSGGGGGGWGPGVGGLY